MDECQWEVDKELVEDYTFKSKEEAEEFSVEGKLLSDPVTLDGEVHRMYSVVGELASKASKAASDYYGLRVDLDSDYVVGNSWKDCH